MFSNIVSTNHKSRLRIPSERFFAALQGNGAVGRCKLDPSLKAPCFQPFNLRVRTLLST